MKKRREKQFYSHIIELDSILFELNRLDISSGEKAHLVELVDSNLHQAILEEVLSHLNDEEKVTFLEHMAEARYSDVWQLLEKRIDHVEDKIKKIADEVKDELHEDIKEVKSK
jgi:uncharacterized protein YPO0396